MCYRKNLTFIRRLVASSRISAREFDSSILGILFLLECRVLSIFFSSLFSLLYTLYCDIKRAPYEKPYEKTIYEKRRDARDGTKKRALTIPAARPAAARSIELIINLTNESTECRKHPNMFNLTMNYRGERKNTRSGSGSPEVLNDPKEDASCED